MCMQTSFNLRAQRYEIFCKSFYLKVIILNVYKQIKSVL